VSPGIGISENHRVVQVTLPRRLTGVRGLPVEIPVRWANPINRPKQIDCIARFSYLGFPVNNERITLLNLEKGAPMRANLLRVLADPQSHFYFPRAATLLNMSYDAFSPLTAAVQTLPGTTVWGTMWPAELSFWHSRYGGLFLVNQLVQFRQGGERARRIAISPDSADLTPAMCLAYLSELEVHHRHEVDIRLMHARELRAELHEDADALLCLGDRLGVYYRGVEFPVSNAAVGLLIEPDGIGDMRELYEDIQPRGASWSRSAWRARLLDSPIARSYITERERVLQRLAAPVLAGTASRGVLHA
jgi:hypothetical protein